MSNAYRKVSSAILSLSFSVLVSGCAESEPAAKTPSPSVASTEQMVTPVATEMPGTETPPAAETVATTQTEPSTDGVWKVQLATMAGTPLPTAITDTISLTLTGDNYLVKVGESPDKGTCIVNRSVTPYQMTITGIEGPNAGKTLLAVFDFPDAATMRVCYDLKGAAFPSSFDSTAENTLYSVIYVRSQKTTVSGSSR